ncbi:N-acetylglucosamine-6-phosphate deacetylase [Mesoplasma seiffertii]|uniref:N-acetylglucosamine-6-phosphate deacetylase n=1 Tax=Mesoplasma seiffertii TaxID=28224 RepID=UPI00047D6E71|nr:N-acetylglucosamine-6-phosphate deacetylase [Mesoplasma seiffertii]
MIIKNGKLVLENAIIENGTILIKDNKIVDITNSRIDVIDEEIIDAEGNWVLPGFIDCHVHGGYGVDFETGNEHRFETFAQSVAQEGITKYIQASVTNSLEDNLKYYAEFGKFMKNGNHVGAKCLGAHMEGPFISPERKGAHDAKFLMLPNIELTKKWNDLCGGNIKIVTYAADLQNGDYTTYLVKNNILPSVGHTDLIAAEFEKDRLLGAKHVTHLFNGMSGVDQHRPGLATATLINDDVIAEVISDGIHLKPEILKLIYKVKTADGICIITDSMNAKGLKDGEYKIGNLDVIKKGIEVRLISNGSLAGAGATYDHNVRTFKEIANIPMTELIKMTSINIAKQLNIFAETGSLAKNKLADIVILDKDLKVKRTIVEGCTVFKS